MNDVLSSVLAKRDLDIIQTKNRNTGLYEYTPNVANTELPIKQKTQSSSFYAAAPNANNGTNIFQPRQTYQSQLNSRAQRGKSFDKEKLNESRQLPYVTSNSEYGSRFNSNNNSKHLRLKSAFDLSKNSTLTDRFLLKKEQDGQDTLKLKVTSSSGIKMTRSRRVQLGD